MEVKAEPKAPKVEKQNTCLKCGVPLTPNHQCAEVAPQEIIDIGGKKYRKIKLENGQTALQEVQEIAQTPEKPPLTPEQIEHNKQFTARSLKWLREKTKVEVDPGDESFLADLAKDILEELRWKIPAAFKAIVFFLAVIVLYILPAVGKVREKINAARNKLTGKSEEKAETKPQ